MIRLAIQDDIHEIMRVYDIAKQYMYDNGNKYQWLNGYPQREKIEKDIKKQEAYVIEEDNKIHGVFIMLLDGDPLYNIIEGNWLNDEPYAAIHRVGSDGQIKGIFDSIVGFAKEKCDNLRIDTHECNHTMQHVIMKNGFQHCGIVYMEDKTARLAYHLKK